MFFLLYGHTDDGVFDDFRIFPKTFEEDPKMFRSYTNEFKYNLRDKLDISESRM